MCLLWLRSLSWVPCLSVAFWTLRNSRHTSNLTWEEQNSPFSVCVIQPSTTGSTSSIWENDAFYLGLEGKKKQRHYFTNIGPSSQSYGFVFFFPFIFISWRPITLQYCTGFCHTLTWISHGYTCVPRPDPPSRLPPDPIPLGLPIAPALSTCLMHPTWAGDLFHPW